MYCVKNFPTKKTLRQAVEAGQRLGIFSPGLGYPKQDGKEYLEGPHFPESHKWYAEVEMKNGIITKVR